MTELPTMTEPSARITPRARSSSFAGAALLALFLLAALPAMLLPSLGVPEPTAEAPAPSMTDRLSSAIADRYRIPLETASGYVAVLMESATLYNEDPLLYAAVAGVESSFRDTAKSGYGAVGLMQVVPRIHGSRFLEEGLSVYKPQDNIRIGAKILDEYRSLEDGDLRQALQRYNGNKADKSSRYASKVAREYQVLASLVGIPAKPHLFHATDGQCPKKETATC